jgi:hypothetical protein
MGAERKFDLERMQQHREALAAAGFKRLSIFISPAARQKVEVSRRPRESASAAINRLILSDKPEPVFESAAEAREWQRRIRAAQNELRHGCQAALRGQPFPTRIWLKDPNNCWWAISPSDAMQIEGEPPP